MKLNTQAPAGRYINARDGALALALLQHADAPEILGTVRVYETQDNTQLPAFHLEAEGYEMPVLVLVDDPKSALRFEVSGYQTVESYFDEPQRRKYATFFKQLCERQGWGVDLFCVLNVVHWLSERQIDLWDDALAAANLAAAARAHFYDFVEAVQLREPALMQ
ncbi:hypothetical protein OPU71_10285 [Niveibacterium sp. 24ML]|uniref:hypothetical protein n=1 Tax=Niveibacterium sp. 24ML TaxID=2985512 RepID=UPI00226F7495|nr:hypothetical protein [Niveibacterium sp. 24ML]MCX9156509.1 hypothetical protein [Niveibacterium sp. 24ML]